MRKMQFAPKNGMPVYHGKEIESQENEFLVDAFVKDDILVIDFYRKSGNKWAAMWRTLMDEREFANYDYEKACWNTKHIHSQARDNRYITCRPYSSWEGTGFNSTEGSRQRIKKYIRDMGGCIYSQTERMVARKQSMLMEEKRQTAAERKYERIQNKMALLPPPPGDFEKVILETAYKNDHILYFNKESAYCTRCGRKVPVSERKHNEHGECPECRKQVVFKHTRYIKEHAEDKEVLYIQSYENEVVLRYFKCALISTSKSKERLEVTESVRTYHEERMSSYKKRYIHYYNHYGHDYWEDRMNMYHSVAYGKNTCLYTGNMSEVREILNNQRKCDILERFGNEGEKINIIDLLGGYSENRINLYEKIYKAGLPKLALEALKYYYQISLEEKERELKKILKISKPMLKFMVEHNGGLKILLILQDAFKNSRGLSDDKIFKLARAGVKVSELGELAQKGKIMKLFHYLQRVEGYSKFSERVSHYKDYMGMVVSMEYDLQNGTVRYPKNLKQAHDKAVKAFYEKEQDKRKREVLRKYPNIKKLEKEVNRQYGFETEKYIIRAPHSAADIVEEGRVLHHCVGGDNYLEAHNSGKRVILFLRKKAEPEKRYYTIEIEGRSILQYYGANDKQPDKKEIDAFLERWKRHFMEVM